MELPLLHGLYYDLIVLENRVRSVDPIPAGI